ncbi:penicillin-insensitive murein endopeptidase [Telluria beijingensis]|uniref:penicillin-insensitive murein endopeptidase n=1 Tax=Telluria beijingensis TaxID=3068633 RepID=UPI0027962109|nr:penicillin-insensitive murein endopeptidase [Massilia sp. REN29]
MLVTLPLLVALAATPTAAATAPPMAGCYGTPAHGAVVGATALPVAGPNFEAYTALGVSLGRTFVHPTVGAIMLETYAALVQAAPGVRFVYGETGLQEGGPFPPHRTHQNGGSIDFMVPLRGADGRSVMLPRTPLNKFGYDVELDAQGRLGDLDIDAIAIAEHLHHLREAARRHGLEIARVILDPPLARRVLATERGRTLHHLRWVWKKVWIRHDEHYHVDIGLQCSPLNELKRTRRR